MVIQLTKALTDVSVIATASREESRDWVRSLGADAVVDHFAEDLAQQVLAIAPDRVGHEPPWSAAARALGSAG